MYPFQNLYITQTNNNFHSQSLTKPMAKRITLLLFLILPFIISQHLHLVRVAEAAAKRRIHITDDLDDVVDDEEDEDWKQWGKKSTPSHDSNLRPSDLSSMSAPDIQAEMMKRHSGPTIGFVKLRLGVPRSRVMESGFGFFFLISDSFCYSYVGY